MSERCEDCGCRKSCACGPDATYRQLQDEVDQLKQQLADRDAKIASVIEQYKIEKNDCERFEDYEGAEIYSERIAALEKERERE